MSLCPASACATPILGGGGSPASEPELGNAEGSVDGLGGTNGKWPSNESPPSEWVVNAVPDEVLSPALPVSCCFGAGGLGGGGGRGMEPEG